VSVILLPTFNMSVMRYVLVILFCLPFMVKAQINLVPNPSFEDTISCPINISNMADCKNWIQPTAGTSDYFNSCAQASSNAGIPQNFWGNKQTNSGNAYCGISVFVMGTSSREYLQVELLDTLENLNYNLEFYFSAGNLANGSNYGTSVIVKNIGVQFSDTALASGQFGVLNYTINNTVFDTNCITQFDNVNWYRFSAVYNATGGEKFITLGNFHSDLLSSLLIDVSQPNAPLSSYIYIDECYII